MEHKLLPQMLDAEVSVLGAILYDKIAIAKVIEILNPACFYKKVHEKIFQSMIELFEKGESIDIVTLSNHLKSKGDLENVGGTYYLTQLVNSIPSAANIEYYAGIVFDKALKRNIISSCNKILSESYNDSENGYDILDRAEHQLFTLRQNKEKKGFQLLSPILHQTIDRIEKNAAHGSNVVGVPSGFKKIDEMLTGFQNSDLIILAGRPAMGKCFGKGTRILMYDGSIKNVEDINANDLLMGNDSTPRRVLSLARGKEMMYWVKQLHGINYRVNESHILSLKRSRNEGKYKHGEIENIELRDYLKKSNKWKTNYKGYKSSVNFRHQDVPIDPYIFGVWLGDGSSRCSRIHNPENEILSSLEAYAKSNNQHVSTYKYKDKCPAHTVTGGRSCVSRKNSLQTKLRKLGVLCNKHIPQIYLSNDRETRLQLLAGLIDTDGYTNEHKHGSTIEITSKHEKLARQIKFLCDSLGYRTSLKSKKAKITSINFECIVWRVRFNGNIDEIPTKLKRKQGKKWTDRIDWQVTGISVEPDKIDDYYGFEIDGNRLFLLEDCTVVHNTALVLNIARNAAIIYGVPVGIFSLEMANYQLVIRMLSSETEINSSALKTGHIANNDWAKVSMKVNLLSEAKIFIDDSPAQSILEIRAKARRLKSENNIGLIILDYLQLIRGVGKNENRQQEISQISQSLKALAKELDVPVIALSQLSRAVENRPDKRPVLSDLRESGAIEQDADVVMFLYREEYYQKNTENAGIVEVIIGKQRTGPTGTVKLAYREEFVKFENLAPRFYENYQSSYKDMAAGDSPF